MPEKPILPTPNQVFNKSSLPSPNDVFNQPAGPKEGFNPNELIQNQDKFNEILNNIEDVSEDEKNVIKNLALAAHEGNKGVTSADVSDAILTLQRQHPNQKGGNKYYMKEVAPEVYKPIAIANDEKPPKGYDVASIWGTQSSANDDTTLTSLGKHLWNGVVGAAEGMVNVGGMAYGAVTGEDSEWYQTLKNSAKSLKFNTPDYEKGEVFNTEGIKSASDFFDPARYDFSKGKVQGQIFQGLESLTSFLLGAKGVSGLTKATTTAGKLGEAYVGSYAVNLGESLQAAEDAGLTGRDKYAYAGITTVPVAALDVAFGTEGLFVKNQLARDAKKTMLNSLAKGFKTDVGEKLTKESLEDLYKVTTAAATQLNKSFARDLAGNVVEESVTESAQALMQNGAQMIYDQLSKDPKFGKDAFSLESIGEYLNNAISGAFGAAGPGVVGVNQQRKQEKEHLQSSNAFEAVKGGKKAVESLRADIYSSYKSGDLTKQEAANAVSKINAYYDFNQQLGDVQLEDEQRKQVLDLAFQKELLYNTIKDTEKEKLSPIELANYEAKATMAKDIQKQINDIVLAKAAKKETVVGDKTMQDIAKKEEKEAEAGIVGTKKPIKVDERKFETIPPVDWNTKQASEKFKILTRDLQESNEPVQGTLTLESGGKGRTTNDTVHVNLPGDKFVITASSAKNLTTQLRGHFKTEFVEGDIENLPVVVKPTQLTSGKTVLGIYNESNGKFISYVREDDKGGSVYSKAEEEQLQHLQATGKLSKGEIEYYKNKRQQPPSTGDAGAMSVTPTGPKPITPTGGLKPITNVTTTEQTRREGATSGTEKPVTGDVSETTEQDVKAVKKTKVRTGKKRNQRGIKSPERKRALEHEVTDPYHVVLQYFAGKGTISSAAIGEFFGTKGNVNKKGETKAYAEKWSRKTYTTSEEKTIKGTETIDALAHTLWGANRDETPNATTGDYKEAIQKAINKHDMPTSFARELNKILGETTQRQTFENEEAYNDYHAKLEEFGLSKEANDVAAALEKLPTETLNKIANSEEKQFDAFGNEIVGIIIRNDINNAEDVFQKQANEKVKSEALDKIIEKLKKSMPKVKIVYDENLDAAGRWSSKNNTITINPFYAGLDTPIHEYGHILIDAMGYNNSVIQKAIAQLKNSDLWKTTQERYPELNEENLAKEVLAEAIGLEGAGIFEKEADKSKFIQYLDYIFDWFKTKLGLNKNIAKSLAKQIVAGIGTTKMQGDVSNIKYQKNKNEVVTGELDATKRLEAGETLYFVHEMTGEAEMVNSLEDYNYWSKEAGVQDWFAIPVEKLQKPKQKPKSLEELSTKELEYKIAGSLEAYQEKVLGRHLRQTKRELEKINATLADDNASAEDKKNAQDLKDYYNKQLASDKKKYMDYRADMDEIAEITSGKSFNEYTTDELIDVYNKITNYQEYAKSGVLNDTMKRVAMALYDKRVNELKTHPEASKLFNEEIAKTQDMTRTDIRFKVLSHINQYFPEFQELSKIYDERTFAKEVEAESKKITLEKLAKKVIQEKNKKLGIVGTAQSWFSSDSAKYFEFLEDPKAFPQTDENGDVTGYSPGFYTVEKAKSEGFSDAQIELLKFMRELAAEREGLIGVEGIYDRPLQVLKTAQTFKEAFKQGKDSAKASGQKGIPVYSEGVMMAVSNILGNNYDIQTIRIPYTNPNTGKTDVADFKTIESEIIKYGKKDLMSMLKAVGLLFKYNIRARKQVKIGSHYDQATYNKKFVKVAPGQYTLDSDGRLIGKFSKQRGESKGYSKDFYRAAMEYIDESSHIKHMSSLVPIVNSIEYLNREGAYGEKGEQLHAKKPNAVEWLEDWRDMHIFKKEKETIPELDLALKTLRFLTSGVTMWFNVPAGIKNAAIGLYNNWRAENGLIITRGNKRLFGERKGKVKPHINQYAVDILRKYKVVSTDIDSNPKIFAGRIFDSLATGLTRYGEYLVQGSGVLGLMTDEDYNSFEYKKDKHGVFHLVVKEGVDEKALERRILALRNRISDIQGKYADKDRRNIQNNELGKAIMQFKVWLPDALKERFGEKYITSDGAIRQGSWNLVLKDGIRDLKNNIKDKGIMDGLIRGKELSPDAKAFMSNLKGLMVVTFLLSLTMMDDDDDEKRKSALSAQGLLADIMMIFDFDNAKFTIDRPIAAMGTASKLIEAADHLFAFEESDYDKRTGKAKIFSDIIGVIPGRKIGNVVESFDEE